MRPCNDSQTIDIPAFIRILFYMCHSYSLNGVSMTISNMAFESEGLVPTHVQLLQFLESAMH